MSAGYIRGIKSPAAPATRNSRLNFAVVIPLDAAERTFLLCRLADITSTAEAILHPVRPGVHLPPWGRHQLVEKIAVIVKKLRTPEYPFLVVGAAQKAILAEAIEGNPYFARMVDDDPRLCASAIRRADLLRLKLVRLLGLQIGPVPLGRKRI